jgi:AcrR family transcriptional regulator
MRACCFRGVRVRHHGQSANKPELSETDRFDGLFGEGYGTDMVATQPRTRRTQAERRSHTRRVLIEATLASLSELGYPATTTLEVERRAGVSRGARLHHFPNKASLLSAALEFLSDQLSERYAPAFAASPSRKQERQRIRAGLHELFTLFQHPYYVAVLELSVAARTDKELQAQLRRVSDRSRALALDAAKKVFPALRPSDAERLVETIRVAFVGLRMQEGVTADKRHTELVLSVLEDAIVQRIKLVD